MGLSGIQTEEYLCGNVKMYSTQTFSGQILLNRTFENDVKFIFVNNKNR